MNDNHKKLVKLAATYSLSCDGWVPVKVKDWNLFIDSVNELTEENARLRDALKTSTCAFESFYNLDDNDVDPMHYGEYQAVSGIVSRNKQLLKGDEDE